MICRAAAFLLSWFLLALPVAARPGTVETRNGRTVEGDIHLDPTGALLVVPNTGAHVRVPLSDLVHASFRADNPAAPAPATTRLSPPWSAKHIGSFGLIGSVSCHGNTFEIQGSGADAFYFVYHPLSEVGDIIARLASIQNGDPSGIAGVMIRADSSEEAPFMLLAATGGGKGILQTRAQTGRISPRSQPVELTMPVWLRLSRDGGRVKASLSRDGQKWQEVGQTTIPLGTNTLAGLAVASSNNQQLNLATFDNVVVTPTPSVDASQRVTLVTGSTVPARLRELTDSVVGFQCYGREFRLPVFDIARIHFRTVPFEKLAALPPGRQGVLLTGGDFYDGEFGGFLDHREVRIRSVLFGPRNFRLDHEVAVVVFRDLAAPTTTWLVASRDGTILQSNTLVLAPDRISVQDPTFGLFRINYSEILHLRRQGP